MGLAFQFCRNMQREEGTTQGLDMEGNNYCDLMMNSSYEELPTYPQAYRLRLYGYLDWTGLGCWSENSTVRRPKAYNSPTDWMSQAVWNYFLAKSDDASK